MMRLTVEGASAQELRKALLSAAAALGADTAEEPAPKAKAKAKPEPEPEEDEPAPKAKAKAKPKDEPAELDYETDIRTAVVALSKDHGRDVALEVLGEFTNPATDEPCTKGQEVDPADWTKLLKKIKAKRAELED